MSIVLSCPNCATRYRANPQAIGANGRKVRCTSCDHVWTATGDDPDSLPPIEAAPAETFGQAEVDDLFEEEAAPAKPHQAFRAKVEARRRKATLAAVGGAWGGLGLMVAALLIGAWVFRVDVVNLWPRASSAYAMVGAEVNPYGFSLGEIEIEGQVEHGVPVLIIDGEIRNFDRRERAAPTLRAYLLDADGHPVLEWPVRLDVESVRAGRSERFRTIVSDPPPDAVEAEIRIAPPSAPSSPFTAEAAEGGAADTHAAMDGAAADTPH